MLVKLCLLILFEIDLHNLLTSPPTYTLAWECFPLTPTSGPPRYTRGWGCLICVGQTEECQQPKIVLILWFYSLLYTHLDRCAEWAGQVNRPGQGWIKSHFPVLFRTDSFRTSIDSFRICTYDIHFWNIYNASDRQFKDFLVEHVIQFYISPYYWPINRLDKYAPLSLVGPCFWWNA